jgi:hypothetical protein
LGKLPKAIAERRHEGNQRREQDGVSHVHDAFYCAKF